MIAMLAVAGAGICNLERNHNGPVRKPVYGSLCNYPQRFPKGTFRMSSSLKIYVPDCLRRESYQKPTPNCKLLNMFR